MSENITVEHFKLRAEKLVEHFKESNAHLKYSIKDFYLLDSYIDHMRKENKNEISKDVLFDLFCVGAYMGETFIQLSPGAKWEIDHDDYWNSQIRFSNESLCWPLQKAFKRFQSIEDELTSYGKLINPQTTIKSKNTSKRWWQFR